MVPAVAAASMGIRTLAARAVKMLSESGSKLASASPSVLTRIATRVGAKADPASIVRAVKDNKLMTAYVLYELYGMADETLQAMMAADQEIAKTVSLFGFVPDEPGSTSTSDLSQMKDEFDIIASAIGAVGSFERLLTLKKALSLSDATYLQYRVVRDMGKVMR